MSSKLISVRVAVNNTIAPKLLPPLKILYSTVYLEEVQELLQ